MSRAMITINGQADRRRVAHWANQAPAGTRVEFRKARRSTDQNAKMWAMLTDVAIQVPWHGVKLTPDDYKLIFLDALRRELGESMRIVPNIEGTGFVNLGTSSSDLSKDEMSMLIELIHKFGANHGVAFHDDESRAA